VAPRLIADGDDLELLAMEDAPDIAALKGWRYDLFGAQAQELVRGQLALKVERGAVVPMPTRTGAAHKTPTAS
jgi:ribonuclease D